jgi:asparaginyl-tRNA synthetase
MVDTIGLPVLLTHFPVAIKSFYMQKAADDPRVTESVDILMPNVGEVTGGSMRIWDHAELMAAFKRENISPAAYDFYISQRVYGSSPHGGYGIGAGKILRFSQIQLRLILLERILAWIMGLWTVREACLYPRFMGRCLP